jgi:hypothetical protein
VAAAHFNAAAAGLRSRRSEHRQGSDRARDRGRASLPPERAAAFNSGKWANGLRRAGKAGWQAAVAAKGATNFSNGVNAAEGKVADAFAPLLAFEQNLQNQVARCRT